MRHLLLYLALLANPAQAVTIEDAKGQAVEVRDASRIVAVGGAITETIYALGEQSRLVGVDTTSMWPEAARKLPQVGYQRTLAAEGILALRPTLVLGNTQAGPPEVLDKLRSAGVTVLILNNGPDVEHALRAIENIARVVGRESQGKQLVSSMRSEIAALPPGNTRSAPRVLFVLSTSGGAPLAAGNETHADSMIRLAGGKNVVSGFEGYRPLSGEAVVSMAPDVVLAPDHVVAAAGGPDKLLALHGIAETPAARSHRLVIMDGLLLLGMGPRLGEAARELHRQLSGTRDSSPRLE
jgi:iron complex transport system substrate-binding protein